MSDESRYRGCWTCRVRKKKCDGSPDRCQTCCRLGIVCDGYGTRPSWLDGGDKERQRRMELKSLVKKNSWNRHRPKPPIHLQSPLFRSPGSTFTRLASTDDQNDSWQETTSIDRYVFSMNDSSPIQGTEAWSIIDQQSTDESSYAGIEASYRSSGLQLSTSDYPQPQNFFRKLQSHAWVGMDPVQGQIVTPEQQDPALLITRYLDQVFPIQFPNYRQSVVSEDRSWVLMLLRDSVPFYWVVLALGAFQQFKHDQYQLPRSPEFQPMVVEEWQLYHTIALREFATRLSGPCPEHFCGTERFKFYTEALACMMQLLALEVGADSHMLEAKIAKFLVANQVYLA